LESGTNIVGGGQLVTGKRTHHGRCHRFDSGLSGALKNAVSGASRNILFVYPANDILVYISRK